MTQRLDEIVLNTGDSDTAAAAIAIWWGSVLEGPGGARRAWLLVRPREPPRTFRVAGFRPDPEPITVRTLIQLGFVAADGFAVPATGATLTHPRDEETSRTVLADPTATSSAPSPT